ncbi:DUF485 domain-containing protein [Phorcysia thermohydrogeniphila]|uniref:Uncharacterized membrane protein (DUF485 family) n=1 Tax=Phorcysia thermohydrogeniphila TaxID=936138 RepID=A0A4R1G9S7_9BACT|nr:DUF485 domain-containing protein [Phorcysia thermohydrogeniphila]TCK03411.1 uncharacterized membrane protein (DUF485 family) [Phorcysia thermohydrogeniphila]
MRKEELLSILRDPEFQELAKNVTKVVTTFTIIMLVVYYSFILMLAYGKDFLSTPICSSCATTIGIIVGIGVIIFSWLLTGAYIWWANSNYDPTVRKLREKFRR